MKIFFDGLSTGFFLQLALGPVFFLILNITLSSNLLNGIFAALGVTLVDFGYISLSLLGN
jgi:threonine/homoserine/homoserine lactone efflux protein